MRERKEGKGELRMAFSFSVCFTRSFSITARLVCSFFLFISLFLCSLNHPHIWFGPPTPSTPLHPHTPTLPNPTAAALQCSFLAPSLLLVVAPYVRECPLQITRTHKHIHTHRQTDRQCFSFCFLKVQLLLLISCFVGLTFAYLGLRTEVAKPCAVSPSLST